eukprot:CAMPEP_0172612206 /NCGR_PEP_ID=MMETSP1068-20121228/31770_1 /TAXON_ID=35684 /ORGANISM="Pseudopedinella elastica, Strain CCMP716" /LENGTH=835 /DNA_ID=CAMNT_0013416355 /DNA_START=8 /DNA_END=2515 /DNA_ORIENTATION=+
MKSGAQRRASTLATSPQGEWSAGARDRRRSIDGSLERQRYSKSLLTGSPEPWSPGAARRSAVSNVYARRPSDDVHGAMDGLHRDCSEQVMKTEFPREWDPPAEDGRDDRARPGKQTSKKRRRRSEEMPVTGGIIDVIQQGLRQKHIKEAEAAKANQCIVLPNSNFRMVWDVFLLVCLSFVAIFTPFQMAFLSTEHDLMYPGKWIGFFVLDRFIDLVFVLDIGINFRSAWYNRDGSEIVFNQREAAMAYFQGWFTLDLLSLLPWDALSLIVNFDGDSALRFPKLLKVLRLIKILRILRATRVVKRVEQNVGLKYGVLRLTKFAVMLVVLAHWLACALMFVSTLDDRSVSSYDDLEPGANLYSSRTEREQCLEAVDGARESKWRWGLYCACECEVEQMYVAALYWSTMTLTTIGYGDVSPKNSNEMVFMIFAMLLGAACFSFVVGTCCSLIEGLDKMGHQFQEEFDDVNDYMRICGVDAELRRRVRAYVLNYKEMATRRNEKEVLSLLSPALREQFTLHNYSPFIKSVPVLEGASDAFVTEMANHCSRNLYAPRDTISDQGTENEPFFVLVKGEAIVCRFRAVGEPVEFETRLFGSGHWNLRLLAFDAFADSSVQAISFVEVAAFDSSRVRDLLGCFPEGYLRVKQAVLRKLWKYCNSMASVRQCMQRLQRALADGTLKCPPQIAANLARRVGMPRVGSFKADNPRASRGTSISAVAEGRPGEPNAALASNHRAKMLEPIIADRSFSSSSEKSHPWGIGLPGGGSARVAPSDRSETQADLPGCQVSKGARVEGGRNLEASTVGKRGASSGGYPSHGRFDERFPSNGSITTIVTETDM